MARSRHRFLSDEAKMQLDRTAMFLNWCLESELSSALRRWALCSMTVIFLHFNHQTVRKKFCRNLGASVFLFPQLFLITSYLRRKRKSHFNHYSICNATQSIKRHICELSLSKHLFDKWRYWARYQSTKQMY